METPDLPSPIALEEIFRVAEDLPALEREAYLDAVCEGRPEMRARIERMREVGGIAALLQQGANETVPAEIETELERLQSEEGGERIFSPINGSVAIQAGGDGRPWSNRACTMLLSLPTLSASDSATNTIGPTTMPARTRQSSKAVRLRRCFSHASRRTKIGQVA